MLTEARKIPHLRDIVSGLLTPVIAAQLRPVAEMFLREIEAEGDYFQRTAASTSARVAMHPDGSHHMPTPRTASDLAAEADDEVFDVSTFAHTT